MYCIKCGNLIEGNANFCAKCGNMIKTNKKFCTKCGNLIEGNEKFCTKCGESVNKDSILISNNIVKNKVDIGIKKQEFQNKRMYLIDQNNKIVKDGISGGEGLVKIVKEMCIILLIYLIFHIILEVFIGLKINFVVIIGLIFGYFVIKFIINTSKYYPFAYLQFFEAIITYNNTYIILKNSQKYNAYLNASSAISLGNLLSNTQSIGNLLLNLNFCVYGLSTIDEQLSNEIIEKKETIFDMIENNKLSDFETFKYENVKFVREDKNKYYFVGDLKRKNRTIKNKRFSIGKIYCNYENLKIINN